MNALFAKGEPEVLFVVPNVKYAGAGNERRAKISVGHLLFTDGGVVFAQLAEYGRADPGWGALFGVVGAAVAGATQERRASGAAAAAAAHQAGDIRQLLDAAERVILIPREEITDIGWRKQGFVVCSGALFRRFGLKKGKRTWKEWEARVEDYLGRAGQPETVAPSDDAENPYRTERQS
jgi:hypothetical protein